MSKTTEFSVAVVHPPNSQPRIGMSYDPDRSEEDSSDSGKRLAGLARFVNCWHQFLLTSRSCYSLALVLSGNGVASHVALECKEYFVDKTFFKRLGVVV